MSSDVIREINVAVERRDLQAFAERIHPDALWEHNPGGGSPEEGTYEGRAQIRQLFERILEGWEYLRPVTSEVRESDHGVYLVRGELHCKHTTSDSEIVEPYEQRLEFRDGLLSKGRMVLGAAA
jgi:ketosteroid isomerase-like protein